MGEDYTIASLKLLKAYMEWYSTLTLEERKSIASELEGFLMAATKVLDLRIELEGEKNNG